MRCFRKFLYSVSDSSPRIMKFQQLLEMAIIFLGVSLFIFQGKLSVQLNGPEITLSDDDEVVRDFWFQICSAGFQIQSSQILGFHSISIGNPFELQAFYFVVTLLNFCFSQYYLLSLFPMLQTVIIHKENAFFINIDAIISGNQFCSHIIQIMVITLIFVPLYHKFKMIVYSKIGSDLYLQWAYGFYSVSKTSNILMAIIGLPQIVALFIFEPAWYMCIVYIVMTSLHWLCLQFGYFGLKRQKKGSTMFGLLGSFVSTTFFLTIHILRFTNIIDHYHLSNINVQQLILYGGFTVIVLVVMITYTLKCAKNFGLGIMDFCELENATKKSGTIDSNCSQHLSVLMKL